MVVLAGGVGERPAATDRLRWAVPPLLRAVEYGGAAVDRRDRRRRSLPAAFALLCAVAFRHYDARLPACATAASPPPRWVRLAGGGWDGRLVLACVLLLAGALPAGFYALAVALACLFVGEAHRTGWRHAGRAQPPVYDDEEDEAD